jgi:hypothetical protein
VVVVTVPEGHRGPKDDARDAWALAESLRVGGIKRRVYKDGGPYSELRAVMRSYLMLRDDVRRTKNRLKAVYRSRGLMPPANTPFHSERHLTWARKPPPEQAHTAAMLLEQLQLREALWTRAEERLALASKKHPVVKLLATAPAIGPIRSAQIVATVVTPHRFRTKRQLWAYCGLATVMRSSANWELDRNGSLVRSRVQQSLGLNQNRSGALKEVFKGAAHQVATQMTRTNRPALTAARSGTRWGVPLTSLSLESLTKVEGDDEDAPKRDLGGDHPFSHGERRQQRGMRRPTAAREIRCSRSGTVQVNSVRGGADALTLLTAWRSRARSR